MEYIDIKKGYTKEDIKEIAKIIKSGGIVAIPTDTVYGIATSCTNEEAVRHIYDIKNRPATNPINIMATNIKMIKKVTKGLSKKEKKIIKKFFPGAMTIILEKKDIIPEIVTARRDTVGIRIPDSNFLLDLIENIGEPIVATSCNSAGEEPLINPEEILNKFGDKLDCLVDDGKSKIGKPSTIIKVENEKVIILREGPISKEEIQRKIGKC